MRNKSHTEGKRDYNVTKHPAGFVRPRLSPSGFFVSVSISAGKLNRELIRR